MSSDIDNHAVLSRTYWVHNTSLIIVMSFAMAGFIDLSLLPAQFNAKPFNQNNINIMVAISVVLGAIAIGFAFKVRDSRLNDKEISTVKAFRALDTVRKYIKVRKNLQKKESRIAVDNLRIEMTGWVGTRMPESMSKPINDVAETLRQRVLPVINKGDSRELDVVQTVLETLLSQIAGETTPDSLRTVLTLFEPLTPDARSAGAEITESVSVVVKPEVSPQKSITKKKFAIACIIFGAGLGSAFITFFTLPIIFAANADEITLAVRIPPFFVIFGLGVGATITYLFKKS